MAKKRVVKKKTTARSKAKTTARAKPAKRGATNVARSALKRAAPTRAAAKRAPAAKAKAQEMATQTVTPYLCCKGAAAALEFYKKGFGAEEMMRMTGPDGAVGHADMQIEGASIMLSDEWPDGGVFAPSTVGGTPVTIHLYVPDVDAFFERALGAGATVLRAVADMPYGDRTGTLRDPYGHRWMVATKQESVGKDELTKRFGGEFKIT